MGAEDEEAASTCGAAEQGRTSGARGRQRNLMGTHQSYPFVAVRRCTIVPSAKTKDRKQRSPKGYLAQPQASCLLCKI